MNTTAMRRAPRLVLATLVAAAAGLGVAHAKPSATPAGPVTCEVEITGKVKLPKGTPPNDKAASPMTFVALGDCLAPTPRIVGFSGSTRGRFFVEVFVPEGSELSLCAALESAPGGPSTLYGKAKAKMVARGRGEVEFKNLVVELAPGPAKSFPHHSGAY